MATPKKFLTREVVQIILGIITAATTLGVAYFEFVWKPSQASAKPVEAQYSGRILDAASQRPISNAKISIALPGSAPEFTSTDTEGYYLISVAVPENARIARLRVEADGYEPYERNISLASTDVGDIRIPRLPTPTAITLPSDTPTLPPPATATIAAPTETLTPLPASPSVDLSIDGFAFCSEQEIDAADVCTVSHTSFPPGITKIFMSWVYRGNYSGTYSRIWYTNGVLSALPTNRAKTWGGDGVVDTTSLTNNNGFLPADYAVEFRLDSNNRLIFKAAFTVQ